MDRIAQPLKATNDARGNPREVVVVYDLTPGYPRTLAVVEVGLMSTREALDLAGFESVETMPQYYVTGGEYQGWKRTMASLETS